MNLKLRRSIEKFLSLVISNSYQWRFQPSFPYIFLPDNIDSTLLQSDFLYTANVTIIQRRGSVPCENLSSTNRNNCNGKTKNRKKMLRRRSSGGAEILCPIVAESEPSSSGSSSWYRFKRSEPSKNRSDLDMLLTRRRGSLPVEVLAVSHSGKYAAKITQWWK